MNDTHNKTGLIEHEFPITQDWDYKESARSLYFYCDGEKFASLHDAIKFQAEIEGKPRPPVESKRRKVK